MDLLYDLVDEINLVPLIESYVINKKYDKVLKELKEEVDYSIEPQITYFRENCYTIEYWSYSKRKSKRCCICFCNYFEYLNDKIIVKNTDLFCDKS